MSRGSSSYVSSQEWDSRFPSPPRRNRQAEAARYVDEFVKATGWHRDRIGLFGGALRYSEYGFLKRLMIKRITNDATGDTDTSRDYEYTDWEEVDHFAADFAAFVEGRLGVTPPRADQRNEIE